MKRTEKLTIISPKDAEKYLTFNNFVGQRNIREKHCLQLAQKMEDGRFHVGNVALVEKDGATFLADGQHQLTACTLAGKPFKAVLQEYSINGSDEEDALARIFSQFNVDSPRTRGDIAWIYGCELGWEEWPRRLVVTAASALAATENGVFSTSNATGYRNLSKDDAAALLARNQKVCEWMHSMNIITHRHMRRMPVIAAMVTTWRKGQRAATEFWTAIRDGEELRGSDPRFVLREYLKETSIQGGQKNPAGKQTADNRCMYSKCIHGWNAWRSGKTTALKYHVKSSVPKPV